MYTKYCIYSSIYPGKVTLSPNIAYIVYSPDICYNTNSWHYYTNNLLSTGYERKIFMDLFQIINKIKKRPGMYLGSNSITALSHFLNGYQTAYHDLEIYWNGWLFPLDFKYMSGFTNIRLKCDNTMGWFNNILNFCDGDEKTALCKFFDLYDEFRQVHMKCYWKAILTENNIQYNNSMEHAYMLTENGRVIPCHQHKLFCFVFIQDTINLI